MKNYIRAYIVNMKKCIHSSRATYYENITIYYHKESWHDYHLKAINMITIYNTVLDPMTLIVTHRRWRTRTLQHKASTRIEILLQKRKILETELRTLMKKCMKKRKHILRNYFYDRDVPDSGLITKHNDIFQIFGMCVLKCLDHWTHPWTFFNELLFKIFIWDQTLAHSQDQSLSSTD